MQEYITREKKESDKSVLKVGTATQVRSLDESAVADYGIDPGILMENAAIAARKVIAERWGVEGKNILVVCGNGNNGGDGFALARLLHAQGAAVCVLLAGDAEKIVGAAKSNYQIVRQLPIKILTLDVSPVPNLLNAVDFNGFDLIVDALFGTGLSRKVQGPMAELLTRINLSQTAAP